MVVSGLHYNSNLHVAEIKNEYFPIQYSQHERAKYSKMSTKLQESLWKIEELCYNVEIISEDSERMYIQIKIEGTSKQVKAVKNKINEIEQKISKNIADEFRSTPSS